MFLATLFSIYLIWSFQDRLSSSKRPINFFDFTLSTFCFLISNLDNKRRRLSFLSGLWKREYFVFPTLRVSWFASNHSLIFCSTWLTKEKKGFKFFTAWKVFKYEVFSGPYFPAFRLRISPYSVRMQENTDQKNSVFGHFSRSPYAHKKDSCCLQILLGQALMNCGDGPNIKPSRTPRRRPVNPMYQLLATKREYWL